VLANSIDLTQIAIIGSASFLLIFFIVNIAAFKLSKEIKANRFILFFACVVSFIALITLLVHTYVSDTQAIVIFFAFIILSILFELGYGKYVRKHIFKRAL